MEIAAPPNAPFPVLLYHGLARADAPAPEGKHWVRENSFRTQLQWLAHRGWRGVRLEEARRPGPAFGRRLAVSFDGGSASDFSIAFPLLQQENIPAEFFINPANIGGDGYMNWPQVKTLVRAGMSVQSHGWVRLDLTRLPAASLAYHLRRSREEIEDQVGRAVCYLSAPYGFSNRRVLEAAQEAGYQAVCTAGCGWAEPEGIEIPRLGIAARTTLRDFDALLEALPQVGFGGAVRRQAQVRILAPAGHMLHRWRSRAA